MPVTAMVCSIVALQLCGCSPSIQWTGSHTEGTVSTFLNRDLRCLTPITPDSPSGDGAMSGVNTAPTRQGGASSVKLIHGSRNVMLGFMIRRIAPQFFTLDIPATLAYYKDKLGFECLRT